MFSPDSIVRGRQNLPMRVILLGPEKVGKSTWAASSPAPLIIPMKQERGLDQIDGDKAPPVMRWSDLLEVLEWLYSAEHSYQSVVLDSSSALQPLIYAEACAAHGVDNVEKILGGYGKWKNVILGYWETVMEGLDALRDQRGMHSILIGHVTTREVNDPETEPYTAYAWDIEKSAASSLAKWADAILFANFKRAMLKETDIGFNKVARRGMGTGERKLYTEKRPAHPGGCRYPGLPYEMPLAGGWPAFANAIALARGGGKEATAAA